jgi:hypothetical protein
VINYRLFRANGRPQKQAKVFQKGWITVKVAYCSQDVSDDGQDFLSAVKLNLQFLHEPTV